MNQEGILKALALLGVYWTTYKCPSKKEDIDLTISAWAAMFSKVPNEVVFNEITQIAAEGREFAPTPGQIYAGIKARHEGQKVLPCSSPLLEAYEAYANKYHSRGLPTMGEYYKQGHTSAEWFELVKEVINDD